MELITQRTQIQERQFDDGLFTSFLAWLNPEALRADHRIDKTTRSYLTNLRQFAAWLKYADVKAPTRADVLLYRSWICEEHDAIALDPVAGWKYRRDPAGNVIRISCKPNTAAQYIRIVKQFFRWTASEGLYPDVAANVKIPKIRHDVHRKDALEPADVLQIERSIDARARIREQEAGESEKDTAGRIRRSQEQGKRLRAIYLLAVTAGLRTVEISRANVKDIETKGGQAWIWIWGKGHSEPDQKKALAREVAEAVKEYLASRSDRPTGSSPLFVATGNRSGGERLAPTTISSMLKAAMKGAGFDSERITAHSLRHTAGTAVQDLTGDLYTTQRYMRHANPATTEIYLHNNTDRQEAAIAQQLYDLYHQAPEEGRP